MTDSDEPAPPRDPPAHEGPGKRKPPSEGDDGGPAARAIRGRGDGGTGAHVAPTDPAVPNAKRRGAMRRKRSFVGLAAVIVGLLSTTLVLLYRASMRVGGPGGQDGMRYLEDSRSGGVAFPADVVHEGTLIRLTTPAPELSGTELGDDAPSGDNAPAGSASSFPKEPPPALDIIRTPAF